MISSDTFIQSLYAEINALFHSQISIASALMGNDPLTTLYREDRYDYDLNYKISSLLIHRLLRYYYTSGKYFPDGIDEDIFTSHYGYQYGDDYFSKNYVQSVYGSNPFECSYVHSTIEEDIMEEDEDGFQFTTNSTFTIFRGIPISINVPMYFSQSLFIYPGSSKIDHKRFSKTFSISCDDPIYTRYILTQSFMEKIIMLCDALNTVPTIWFIGNYVIFKIGYDDFLPNIDFRDFYKHVNIYAAHIELPKTIIDTLKFDQHSIALNEVS